METRTSRLGAVSGYKIAQLGLRWVLEGRVNKFMRDLCNGENETERLAHMLTMRSSRFLEQEMGDQLYGLISRYGATLDLPRPWLVEHLRTDSFGCFLRGESSSPVDKGKALLVSSQGCLAPIVYEYPKSDGGRGKPDILVRPLAVEDVFDVICCAAWRRCDTLSNLEARQYTILLSARYFAWIEAEIKQGEKTCIALDPRRLRPVWADYVLVFDGPPVGLEVHPAEVFADRKLPLPNCLRAPLQVNESPASCAEFTAGLGGLGWAYVSRLLKRKQRRLLVRSRDGAGIYFVHRSTIPFELPSPL